MFPLSPMTSGLRRAPIVSALLLVGTLLSGCMYGFTGGGLPAHIRTVYVDLFENSTPDESLRPDVQRALQQQLPRELGVRLAPQASADAIIRGRITGYDEVTVNVDPNTDARGRLQTNQRRLQLTFDAEIFDIKQDKQLWRGSGVAAIGNWNPQNQTITDARQQAIIDVVRKVVQGAQSQW
jgi:hypothetical protein